MNEIKVADTFFIFDENHRVYEKGTHGRPIYREHFLNIEIIGETSRSWITSRFGMKVPKSNPWPVFKNQQMVDDAVWVRENANRIADKVRSCSAQALRQIETIIQAEKGI